MVTDGGRSAAHARRAPGQGVLGMEEDDELRPGEVTCPPPTVADAGLIFIGRIHTPWTTRDEAPRQGSQDGPLCSIEVFNPWVPALAGLKEQRQLEVIYWLHLSRRDLVLQRRDRNGPVRGTFSIRSPLRPNPIGTSIAELVSMEGGLLTVRGLDCLDGTPLLDLKPRRRPLVP